MLTSPPNPSATVMVLDEPPWTKWEANGENAGTDTFVNSRYIVHVYPPVRQAEGWPRLVHLSIRHIHNIAITDFRDFQRIKTELVHAKAEAVQIFPSEERLVDSCNQYHLFVFVPDDFDPSNPDSASWGEAVLPIGYFYGRDVTPAQAEGANQRPFTENE